MIRPFAEITLNKDEFRFTIFFDAEDGSTQPF